MLANRSGQKEPTQREIATQFLELTGDLVVFLDKRQVASLAGISVSTLNKWMAREDLGLPEPVRRGGRCVWESDRVVGFLQRRGYLSPDLVPRVPLRGSSVFRRAEPGR